MKEKHNIRLVISGGGTGGHIFPAVSIAQEIRRRMPGAEILFVGALGRMEMEKVPAAGFKIIGLPIIGLPRKPGLSMLTFFVRLVKSLRQAKKIIRDFKPDVAVGVGGYASGALLYKASAANIPCLIQEQNSYAGITNKLLRKRVQKICVAFPDMERFFPADKILLTGNPVREQFLKPLPAKNDARRAFNVPDGRKVVLMLGGSLGARTLNLSVKDKLQSFSNNEVFFIWQCGALYYLDLKNELKDLNAQAVFLSDFIYNLDEAYAAADVIISRAGAGTISELCIVGKPVILVPSPNVAEDHQTKNALSLVQQDAALMIPDAEAPQKLVETSINLLRDDKKMNELSQNIKKLALPGASSQIADEVLKLIEKA